MSFNFISQLLDNGIDETELIASLSKSMPKLAKEARKMMMGGWSPKDVINLFSKNKEAQKIARKGLKPVTASEMASIHLQNSYNNVPESSGQESKRVLTDFTKKAAPYAIGAIASPMASSVVQSVLDRALPQTDMINGSVDNLTQNMPQLPNQEIKQNPLNNANQYDNSQQPPSNQVPQSITENANIQQPKVISNPKEYLEKKGVLQSVNESLKRGNNPEQVAVELGIKRSGNAKIDPELLQNIEEYAKIPQEQEVEKPSEPVKIEKNSLVNSPNGVGEVKEIRNGKAIIDVNGKLHKVKEEDLEASPLPEKDLAELYDELISGIESATGEDVSRMVQWAGYNPETNTLQFLPHSGKLYKYSNISPEDAELLTDILSTRKSSGSNFIGAWKAGSKSPIGAALSKLIKKLQSERGGKGNEYEETHEQIYSAYEPAIQAKKKKKK